MLLQEQTTERIQSLRKMGQETLAGEKAPQTASQEVAGLVAKPCSAKHGNQEIVSEALLAEVRELRLKAQETVMSKQKRVQKDRTAWVFLGGMVAAGAIALFLVYTNYVTYLKYIEMRNDVMLRNQQEATKLANKVAPLKLVKLWTFPGAQQHSLITNNTMASATMKVKASYLTVWKYYAQETGYNKTLLRQHFPMPKDGSAPEVSSIWNTTKDWQEVSYKIESQSFGGHPIAYFTEHAGPNTVTVKVTPGASKNVTDITIHAMNAE